MSKVKNNEPEMGKPHLFARIGHLFTVIPVILSLVYLLSIPIFGYIYCVTPSGSFYAPYAKFESDALADKDRVRILIERAVLRSAEARDVIVSGAKIAKFIVLNLRIDKDNSLRFDILGEFSSAPAPGQQQQTGGKNQASAVDLPCVMPAGPAMLVGPRPDETAQVIRPIILDVANYPQSFQLADNEFYGQLFSIPFFPNGMGLIFTRAENADLAKFFDGLQGDPAQVNNAFLRMTYFSVTVMTTVGFGDIVPMTEIARIVVAIQAIFGIVLAGLFVAAVAHRASVGARGRS